MVIIHTDTDDMGVRYELHALINNAKAVARIHIMDVDSGEAVGNKFFPTVEQAETEYAELVAKATK